jgi:hypothetical protein
LIPSAFHPTVPFSWSVPIYPSASLPAASRGSSAAGAVVKLEQSSITLIAGIAAAIAVVLIGIAVGCLLMHWRAEQAISSTTDIAAGEMSATFGGNPEQLVPLSYVNAVDWEESDADPLLGDLYE